MSRPGAPHAYVFKVVPAAMWRAAPEPWSGAPVDLRDGFVHLSAAGQVAGTLARHFTAEEGLLLLWVAPERLDDLRWEVSRGGQPFPHLYGGLTRSAVVHEEALALSGGVHVLGEAFEGVE